MATFNITSNTNIDALTTKGGEDIYNINGAVLTIDSDTRWANNATDTTGPFGTMTISATLGGQVLFDGTKVWWLKYDNGSGNVPAKASTITGATSGATGVLIGVWTAINTTPTPAGSAMPASGYIKFQTTTGTFQNNESLTSGGAIGDVDSATGGQRGYIEIVGLQSRLASVPRLGEWRAQGDYFVLDDVTTGTPGQIVQLPNSGGTNTYYPGIEIETGVGTGVFEQYGAIYAPGSSGWNNTNMGTDDRCKLVECLNDGRVRIGSDGTNNVGYTPVSGLRMRIPNIIFQNTTNTNRALNVIPDVTIAPRYAFNTVASGRIFMDKIVTCWYLAFSQPFSVDITNCHFADYVLTAEPLSAGVFSNNVNGNIAHFNSAVLTLSNSTNGYEVSNNRLGRTGSTTGITASFSNDANIEISDNFIGSRIQRAVQNAYAIALVTCSNSIIRDNTTIGNGISVSGCFDSEVTNTTYYDRYLGATSALVGTYTVVVINSTNTLIDGININYATYGDVAPYLALVFLSGSTTSKVRNFGTFASPLNLNVTNGCGNIAVISGSVLDTYLQRIYCINNRLSLVTADNSNNIVFCENVFGDYADSQRYSNTNNYFRGCAMANSILPEAAAYGIHFNDFFTSTTTGAVNIVFNEKTNSEPSASSYQITGGTPQFTAVTSLWMPLITDEIVYEMQYYAIGHTGFQNVNPTRTGTNTANFTLEYDIDVNDGNGFTGVYKSMTGANLSAETINATLGFKLRVKISVNTATSTNLFTNLLIPTNATTTTQAYQYPLDTYTYTISNLVAGSKVAILDTGTEDLFVPIMTESGGEVSFTFNSDQSGDGIDIAILAPGYVYQRIVTTLPSEDANVSVNQLVDIVYDSGETALVTFDGPTHIIQMDAGSTELNVVGMYTEYVDWAFLSDNIQYFFAFDGAGGNDIDAIAGTSIPKYAFLTNGWRISPDEANHQLDVTTGILVVDGGGNPFNNTVGGYNVQINYQQPVQAITVNTSSTPPGLTLNQFLALK